MKAAPAPSSASATDAHATLHAGFRWQVPERFNIAQVCCGRWAGQSRTARRVAVAWEHEDGRAGTLSYGELQAQADRLSHALQRLGVQRGDRVAIVMPQRPETAVANMAIFQLGAVAMPLSMLFGPDALAYRLQDSGARVAIADESSIANLRAARADCPALQTAAIRHGVDEGATWTRRTPSDDGNVYFGIACTDANIARLWAVRQHISAMMSRKPRNSLSSGAPMRTLKRGLLYCVRPEQRSNTMAISPCQPP